jgi:hypothetical protein
MDTCLGVRRLAPEAVRSVSRPYPSSTAKNLLALSGRACTGFAAATVRVAATLVGGDFGGLSNKRADVSVGLTRKSKEYARCTFSRVENLQVSLKVGFDKLWLC